MAETASDTSEVESKKTKSSSATDDMGSSIKRRKTREFDEGDTTAKTTKGQWS